MKTACIIIISLAAFAFTAGAQTFWTEDFGTGCNTGTLAAGLATSNGVWQVLDVGPPEAFANQWYISAHTRNTGVGICADDCVGGNNQTLHIGNVAIPPLGLAAEDGSYLTGFFCGFGYCSTTHKRVETPVIDCTAKANITLSFLYFEGGDVPGGTNGDCSIWYFDGTAWSMIDPLPKTNNASCTGTIYGVWTDYSLVLPSSADNNPNVKIGFQWDNDDNSAGSDPSAGFDDIELSTAASAAPLAGFTADLTSGCDSFCVTFTDTSIGATSRIWSFPGGNPSTSTISPQVVCYNTPGAYDVSIISTNAFGNDTASQSSFITVTQTPIPDFSVSDQGLCIGDCVSFTDLTVGAVQNYTWTFSGGFPLNSNQPNPSFICYLTAGDFSVTLTTEFSGCTNAITRVAYITVTQPVTPTITIAGDTLISSAALTYQWYEVTSGAIAAGIFQDYIVTLPGDYYVCIQDAFGCQACSDTVHIELNKVNEINTIPFTIFPNPARDVIVIQSADAEISELFLYDIWGRRIPVGEIQNQSDAISVDISRLSSGIYCVEANISGIHVRSKFVKSTAASIH